MEELLQALARQAGLTGRYAISGVGGLGAALANPLAYGANKGLEAVGSEYRFPEQYEALMSALTKAGFPEPEGKLEKGVGFAAEIGVPDPTDSAKVVSSISHMIDPNAMNDLIQAMTVFHGSPHKWDKPDLSKVGTGEGAQAYGHGFYVAENPRVAGRYSSMADHRIEQHGDRVFVLDRRNSDVLGEFPADQIDEAEKLAQTDRHLYELDLPDEAIEKMLDWDKPLSEQPESVRKALAESPYWKEYQEYTKEFTEPQKGGDFYEWLSGERSVDEKASRHLNELGIPGIKYLDGSSRSAGDGTRNFVIFDESYITPLKRNGEEIGK